MTCLTTADFAVGFESSQLFTKTINKISQESVRNSLIYWLEQQDPKLGIAGRDFIGQVLVHGSSEDIVSSYVDVATTLLFLENVSPIVSDAMKNGEVWLPSSNATTQLTREQLVAYTALYLFYRQRIAKNLYVSPFLQEKLTQIRSKIEPYKITLFHIEKTTFKLYISPDMKLWNKYIENGDILEEDSDTGLLNVSVDTFNKILLTEKGVPTRNVQTYISKVSANPLNRNWLANSYQKFNKCIKKEPNSLLNVVIYEELKQTLLARLSGEKVSLTVPAFLKQSVLTSGGEFPSANFNTKILDLFKAPLVPLLATLNVSMSPEATKKEILQNTKFIFGEWLSTYNDKSYRFDYSIFLTGSGFLGNTTEKFQTTIFDQIRYGYFDTNGYSPYLYVGGFLDPIVRAVTNDPNKLFFLGAGIQYKAFNFSVFYGLTSSTSVPGFSVGYQIPLDLLGLD